jgi:hypothetical protein
VVRSHIHGRIDAFLRQEGLCVIRSKCKGTKKYYTHGQLEGVITIREPSSEQVIMLKLPLYLDIDSGEWKVGIGYILLWLVRSILGLWIASFRVGMVNQVMPGASPTLLLPRLSRSRFLDPTCWPTGAFQKSPGREHDSNQH